MNYPYMLILRNSPEGMIWQAYTVKNNEEERLLRHSATRNGFLVQTEPVGYTTESSPNWRESERWGEYLNKYRQGNVKGLQPI